MFTRRDFVAGTLAARTLCRSSTGVPAPELARKPLKRMFSGIMALDDVMGPMSPGELICIAGRPYNGKTMLLLQIATNICETTQQNVIFATLREPPAAIGARAPIEQQPRLRYGNVNDLTVPSRQDLPGSPGVFIVAATTDDLQHIARISRYLQAVHPAGCGLVIIDGGTSDPSAVAPVDLVALCARHGGTVESQLPQDAQPALLSEAHLDTAQGIALQLNIPVLVGIRTGWNLQMHRGPGTPDLLDIQDAVEARASQTVWLHRPELYWKHAIRHHLKGITRLVGQKDRYHGAWPMRSAMRYWPSSRTFVTSYGPMPDEIMAGL